MALSRQRRNVVERQTDLRTRIFSSSTYQLLTIDVEALMLYQAKKLSDNSRLRKTNLSQDVLDIIQGVEESLLKQPSRRQILKSKNLRRNLNKIYLRHSSHWWESSRLMASSYKIPQLMKRTSLLFWWIPLTTICRKVSTRPARE